MTQDSLSRLSPEERQSASDDATICSNTGMMKVTLCVDVHDPEDVAALERWRQAWGARVQFSEQNQGCGCCVDIWDVEAPEEAVAELPETLLSTSAEDHHRPRLREQILRAAWNARGCLGSLLLLAAGLGLLVLALMWLGIPYQDPTPELLAQSRRAAETARTLGIIGISVFACGLLSSLVVGSRWIIRRIAAWREAR
jgi:hypothetical protein